MLTESDLGNEAPYRRANSSSRRLTRPGPEPRVLVIDDDPDQLFTIRVFLDGRGFRTITAGSAEEAKQKVEEAPVDVIVCDILMPRCNGLQLVRELRDLSAGKPCPPVVFVSGGSFHEGTSAGDEAVTLFCPKEKIFSLLPRQLETVVSRRQ